MLRGWKRRGVSVLRGNSREGSQFSLLSEISGVSFGPVRAGALHLSPHRAASGVQ